MIPSIQVVHLHNWPIFKQLQLEEALLRTESGNWCLVNRGSPPAIVLGISGKVDQLVDRDVWEHNPVPLIRRFSGGGTVIVDENTLFTTVICNQADTSVSAYPESVMRYNWELYAPLLRPHGFALQAQDFAIGQHKIAGNAQYMRKGRWLQHTSWLWEFSEDRMMYLREPPAQPEYRKRRSHLDFLRPLNQVIEHPDQVPQQLFASLSESYELHEVSVEKAAVWLQQPHRTSLCYTGWESDTAISASLSHSASTCALESSSLGA